MENPRWVRRFSLRTPYNPPPVHLHRISIQTSCGPRILEQETQNSSKSVRTADPADRRIQIHPPKRRRVLNREMRVNQFNQRKLVEIRLMPQRLAESVWIACLEATDVPYALTLGPLD
eukprot:COSAG02_NODE_789_length_17189_cov_23.034114_11_plen_118_part_00